MTVKQVVIVFFIISSFLILLGFVGSSDYEESMRENKAYCNMVADGAWPAYNKSIDCSVNGGE